MLIITLIVGLIFSQACNSVVRRPEIRELSADQRNRFFNAVKGLRRLNNVDVFQQSSKTHLDNQAQAHGVPAFLPWHREYLRRYELALQRVDSSVVLPYWDWSIDSQSPELSPIFGAAYFGGNGRNGDGCVVNGTFANWQLTVPNTHCLKRKYNAGHRISSWYSPEALETILAKSRTYDQFRSTLEGAPHGSVHVNLGSTGSDFSTMYSPNDPIFYLHHAFIDLLWSEWQQRNPNIANTYNGRNGNRNVQTSDNLIPFNVPVSQVLNTRAPGYCYYYSRFATKVPNNNRPLSRRQDSPLFSLLDSIPLIGNLVISPTDRTTRNKIRTPDPLPEDYIRSNNLNVAQVRQTENELKSLIDSLNILPSFIPFTSIHSLFQI